MPASDSELDERLVHVDAKEVKHLCKVLLSGTTPTNFYFQDMGKYLHTISGGDFIVLPVWTLSLTNLDAAAMAIVNHWPHWTPEALENDEMLRNTRLMLPLFKEGNPIGHARFLFFDRWHPMPEHSLQVECRQWMDIMQEFIPVPGICNTILLEYEGLCPSRHQSECASIKIIDSMPGHVKVFEREAAGFQQLLQMLADPNWEPRPSEVNTLKLKCIRKYLSLVTGSEQETSGVSTDNIETILLPSTTQIGLECIIITVCRVLATWVNPCQVPIEDCTDLCINKKGRRILSTHS